jgi:hypothetical protein
MRKNGRTAAGTQRWKCVECAITYSFTRQDQTDQATFAAFLDYLLGKRGQGELDNTISGRTWRRKNAWCWKVPTPPLEPTGEVYDQLFIDGIYLAYKWVLLTVTNDRGQVVARQWADGENAPAYTALLEGLAPPRLITCDGASGGLKAVTDVWGDQAPPIQRCLLHVHRNNIQDLTNRPQTKAGKALKALSKRLLKVASTEDAAKWMGLLAQVHSEYNSWFNERTYARDDPAEAHRRGKTKPTQWWYTHARDRRVYYRLERLSKQGTLFTFLTACPDQVLHSTTNVAESLNARIKALCYHHRGLSDSHLLAAVDWLLYFSWTAPKTPKEIHTTWDQAGQPHRQIIPKKAKKPTEKLGPAHYDTHATAEEGLWTRKGWAGRSN